jgi:zinc transport system ATP-binding protein
MPKTLIEVRDLWFSYGGPPVLQEVNIGVEERDFACIVGPNGGGKTTLLKLLLGLLAPTRGSVRIFGLPPVEAGWRLGYLPQIAHFDPHFPVTVADVVLMGRLRRGLSPGPFSRADKAAAEAALADVGLPDFWKRPFSDLSGGQRQRVLIARALACQPEILLLDEPTASLDLLVEQGIYNLLRDLNRRLTLVLVSHDLVFVSRFVSKVICVKGEVRVHPTEEVTDEMISRLYGGEMRMVRHTHNGEAK